LSTVGDRRILTALKFRSLGSPQMAKRKPQPAPAEPAATFQAPADGGLSIDRLAQAFAAMMGTQDPYAAPAAAAPVDVVHVDASPDLDDQSTSADDACRVNPASILEALLFVGLPGGKPLSSRSVAGLMRGVRPQEIDDLAEELRHRYAADNCPYEVASEDAGWVMRLRPEFARFGSVLESRARMVRLDAEALDVLALVAWNQPVPRDRLVELGCDAPPATLRQLVRRGLLELRHDTKDGEPVYRTTPKFLEIFKLESLADLPEPTEPPG
jgi:segregation and condensation protein B